MTQRTGLAPCERARAADYHREAVPPSNPYPSVGMMTLAQRRGIGGFAAARMGLGQARAKVEASNGRPAKGAMR